MLGTIDAEILLKPKRHGESDRNLERKSQKVHMKNELFKGRQGMLM